MAFDEARNPYVILTRNHGLVKNSLDEAIDFFDDESPRIVDLGCGNGHFLRDYLLKNPTFKGLGVEKRFKRSFKTAEKISGIPARVLQTQIETFLDESPQNFWNEIWLQFPDPWPKLRHEKNRPVNSAFISRIVQILKPQGRFCFRSDCRFYWEFLQMEDVRHSYFSVVRSSQGDLFADEPPTLFQKKFFSRSIPIYSLEFRKLQ